jgi:uncharacterized membrane protein YdbT with pleckstrin-like domain
MFRLSELPNALPDEELVFLLRRHQITNLWLYFSGTQVLALPFISYWYINTFQPLLWDSQPLMTILVLLGSIFFLFAWLFIFQAFLDFYLDMWIVTNRRILNIEQKGMFSRTISEVRLYRIQDVTATVSGLFHTIFDFGDIEIQTAGEHERFLFEDLPRPNVVTKKILELSEVDRRSELGEAVEEFKS